MDAHPCHCCRVYNLPKKETGNDRRYVCVDTDGCNVRQIKRRELEQKAKDLGVMLKWTEHWWNVHLGDQVLSAKTLADLELWLHGYKYGKRSEQDG